MKLIPVFALLFALSLPVFAATDSPTEDSWHLQIKHMLGKYELCNVQTCYTPLLHGHGNKPYAPHFLYDGHPYHTPCSQYQCDFPFAHFHGDQLFFPKNCHMN